MSSGQGQVVEALGAEKPEALGQDLEDAFGEQDARALGIFLQDVKDDLVLAHGAEVFDPELARHLVQLAHQHGSGAWQC